MGRRAVGRAARLSIEAVTPGYVALFESGELVERSRRLDAMLRHCTLCPCGCGVDRTSGAVGLCGVDARAKVASFYVHPWEEPPLSGDTGSGTVFFSGCTMRCVFCQNYPISQMGVGRVLSDEEFAESLLRLQKRGAKNINLVTGTHQVAAFVRALLLAVPEGLSLPVVHNTSGYETVETLRLLDGVVDIYLPDIKYADAFTAKRLSGRGDYVTVNRKALAEMWRQVGPVDVGADSIARRGMIVRHMILPEDLSGTWDCLTFLARSIGPSVWVSLMSQYFPAHKALRLPPLDRKVTRDEYECAVRMLLELGLENGYVQEHCAAEGLGGVDVVPRST
ncbi:MAG: radical SAM protein [Syntrophobacteraceae bacterium]